jgi:hypothetical protein
MAKNQLFKVIPDRNFVVELLNLYGIKDFYDTHYFTVKNLESLNTLEKIKKLCEKLREYYIPCKAKVYLKNIDIKRCIVILRQFLKCHNFTLYSKEKYFNKVKHTTYRIISNNEGITTPEKKTNIIVVSFD